MDRVKAAIEWFKAHKAAIGAFFLTLATIVGGIAVEYRSDELVHFAAVLSIVGMALTGGGLMKSDEFYRDRNEAVTTQVDRRAGSGTTSGLMPMPDLKKLVNKVRPDILNEDTGDFPAGRRPKPRP